MNESCHTWMSHVTHEWVMSHMNESCHTWMSHVTTWHDNNVQSFRPTNIGRIAYFVHFLCFWRDCTGHSNIWWESGFRMRIRVRSGLFFSFVWPTVVTDSQNPLYCNTQSTITTKCAMPTVGAHSPYPTQSLIHNTIWRRLMECLKLQVIFRQKATKYRALSRNMTCKEKVFYGYSPPCTPRSRWFVTPTVLRYLIKDYDPVRITRGSPSFAIPHAFVIPHIVTHP